MPTFNTSGTTGKPKTYDITDQQLTFRAGTMNSATRGIGFADLKSIFVDYSPKSGIGARYVEYGELHPDVKLHFASLGLEASIELIKQQQIEGITTTPAGLMNYAKAFNGSYQFKWLAASTSRLTAHQSRTIRASLGDNLWSTYGCSEVGVISIASANQIETVPNCVGTIVPGISVSFDASEIVVKSDTLINGYTDPEQTAKSFKNGGYYTGDLGHMNGDMLILDGRKS